MNTIRLPFQWERLQPAAFQELDATDLARLDEFVTCATGQGMNVILDPHNYARYYGVVAQPSELADLWRRLAAKYKDNKHVIFGLMNEPYSMATERWLEMANASIASIRDTGAANLILVPGNSWTGAHSWHEDFYGTPNAVAMKGVVDPLNNFLIEVHQYLRRRRLRYEVHGRQPDDRCRETEGIHRVAARKQIPRFSRRDRRSGR